MSCKVVRKIIFREAIAPCCAHFVCIAGSDIGRQGCWKAWHNSFPGASLVEASTNLGVNRLRDWLLFYICDVFLCPKNCSSDDTCLMGISPTCKFRDGQHIYQQ
jgi:hypothetical protein